MEWTTEKRILDFSITENGELIMDWNDGMRRVFDPKPYLKGAFMEALLDPEYLSKAYLQGHGSNIAWPNDQDFAPEDLYEISSIVDSCDPLPPRSPLMTWDATKLISRLKPLENGKIMVDWSDGTVRLFDTWDHATIDTIEKFVDPAYLAQARIAPDRDAVIWPDGERFDAKTLYERSAIVEG